MDKQTATFDWSAKRTINWIFFIMLGMEILIVLLDGVITYARTIQHDSIRGMFNITREDSLGTWFSCLQAFLAGMAFLLVARSQSLIGNPKWKIIGWALIGCFFLYVSVDDGIKFHERIGTFMGDLSEEKVDDGHTDTIYERITHFPSYYWHIFFMPIFISFGLFMFTFLMRELKTWQLRIMLVTALSFFVISQGLDYLENIDEVHEWVQETFFLREYTVMHFSKSIEEFMEMFGTTLFLMIALRYLLDHFNELRFKFQD